MTNHQIRLRPMVESLLLQEEDAQRKAELFIIKKDSFTAQIELLKKNLSYSLGTTEAVVQETTELFTIKTVVFTEQIELLKKKFLLCSLSIEKTKVAKTLAELSKGIEELSKRIDPGK